MAVPDKTPSTKVNLSGNNPVPNQGYISPDAQTKITAVRAKINATDGPFVYKSYTDNDLMLALGRNGWDVTKASAALSAFEPVLSWDQPELFRSGRQPVRPGSPPVPTDAQVRETFDKLKDSGAKYPSYTTGNIQAALARNGNNPAEAAKQILANEPDVLKSLAPAAPAAAAPTGAPAVKAARSTVKSSKAAPAAGAGDYRVYRDPTDPGSVFLHKKNPKTGQWEFEKQLASNALPKRPSAGWSTPTYVSKGAAGDPTGLSARGANLALENELLPDLSSYEGLRPLAEQVPVPTPAKKPGFFGRLFGKGRNFNLGWSLAAAAAGTGGFFALKHLASGENDLIGIGGTAVSFITTALTLRHSGIPGLSNWIGIAGTLAVLAAAAIWAGRRERKRNRAEAQLATVVDRIAWLAAGASKVMIPLAAGAALLLAGRNLLNVRSNADSAPVTLATTEVNAAFVQASGQSGAAWKNDPHNAVLTQTGADGTVRVIRAVSAGRNAQNIPQSRVEVAVVGADGKPIASSPNAPALQYVPVITEDGNADALNRQADFAGAIAGAPDAASAQALTNLATSSNKESAAR